LANGQQEALSVGKKRRAPPASDAEHRQAGLGAAVEKAARLEPAEPSARFHALATENGTQTDDFVLDRQCHLTHFLHESRREMVRFFFAFRSKQA